MWGRSEQALAIYATLDAPSAPAILIEGVPAILIDGSGDDKAFFTFFTETLWNGMRGLVLSILANLGSFVRGYICSQSAAKLEDLVRIRCLGGSSAIIIEGPTELD